MIRINKQFGLKFLLVSISLSALVQALKLKVVWSRSITVESTLENVFEIIYCNLQSCCSVSAENFIDNRL